MLTRRNWIKSIAALIPGVPFLAKQASESEPTCCCPSWAEAGEAECGCDLSSSPDWMVLSYYDRDGRLVNERYLQSHGSLTLVEMESQA